MGYTLKSAFESEFMLLHSDTLQPIQQGLYCSSVYFFLSKVHSRHLTYYLLPLTGPIVIFSYIYFLLYILYSNASF